MTRKAPSSNKSRTGAEVETRAAVEVDVSPLATLPIGLLGAFITPAVMEAVRARLDLTPEKLTLMLVRLINPDELLSKGEEARLRGVSDEKLKSMRDARELRPL